MTSDYQELLKGYPRYMSLEQMRIVCHISKKTARLLLQNGLVRHKNNGKKTHKYQIVKKAVLQYLIERDKTPEKFMLLEYRSTSKTLVPENSLSKSEVVVPTIDEYPDVLSAEQAAELSSVTKETVNKWARKKKIKAFMKNNTYFIPKLALLEYLQSPYHKRNAIWKQNNLGKREVDTAPDCQ